LKDLKKLGIYVHWPFCTSLCPYCDFNSYVNESIDISVWNNAYLSELSYFISRIDKQKYQVKSVFFVGGTPSLMPTSIVENIIDHVRSNLKTSDELEVTLESNPTSVEMSKMKSFKSAGVNRISLGVQSLRDNHLKFLGRSHGSNDAISSISMIANLFDRYSIDLMYGYSDQTTSEWEVDLNRSMSLINDHISIYNLTIEKGTPFYIANQEKTLILPNENIIEEMYDLTFDILKDHNIVRYEVSNYSKDDKSRCIHNMLYWQVEDYIGIGPGAHGRIFFDNLRMQTMTHHNPKKWLAHVNIHKHGLQKNVCITIYEQIQEILLMCLRVNDGIDIQDILSRLHIDLNFLFQIIHELNLVQIGTLQLTSDKIIPTESGIDMVNKISQMIFDRIGNI